jgi:hypothetical protein
VRAKSRWTAWSAAISSVLKSAMPSVPLATMPPCQLPATDHSPPLVVLVQVPFAANATPSRRPAATATATRKSRGRKNAPRFVERQCWLILGYRESHLPEREAESVSIVTPPNERRNFLTPAIACGLGILFNQRRKSGNGSANRSAPRRRVRRWGQPWPWGRLPMTESRQTPLAAIRAGILSMVKAAGG